MIRIVAIIFTAIVAIGCQPSFDEQAYVQQQLEQRILALSQEKNKDCQLRAVEDAESYVDSLIDTWIGNEVMDTLAFPKRPVRPNAPKPILGTLEAFEAGER